MKHRNLKPLLLLLLISAVSTVPGANAANPATPKGTAPSPFAEGTTNVHLTPEQIQDLSAYIDQSQSALEQALSDAKGVSFTEASRIYLDAVKAVVLASDTAHPRSELLMRVILNQALALTYGIPKAIGNGMEREGVLSRTGYQDLLPVILKQSIQLALAYVDQDRKAAKRGALMDLPYAEVAQKRMILAGQWMRSVLEQQLAAQFGIEALQQWLNTMMAEDQQHQAKFASEIKLVVQALTQAASLANNPSLKPEIVSGEQERLARITMRKVIARMEKSLAPAAAPIIVPVGPSGASGQAAVAVPQGMSFVHLNSGHFTMGSPASESSRDGDENQHEVTVSAFAMQTTDVTQAQWVEVMGSNPSKFKARENCPQSFTPNGGGMCPKHPVERITWTDTQEFVARMNARHDGFTYRLPTEAEWEYAARAGTSTAYSFGDGDSALHQYDWINANSGDQTHDVGTLRANAWGLFDMHGNVYQWVNDWYGDYQNSNAPNPQGPSSSSNRVIRGSSGVREARSADRTSDSPALRASNLGFRLVRTP